MSGLWCAMPVYDGSMGGALDAPASPSKMGVPDDRPGAPPRAVACLIGVAVVLVRRFLSYYRPYRALFALDLGTAAASAGLALAVPVLTREMLKRIEEGVATPALIWQMSAGMAAIVVLLTVARYINTKWGHILGTRMESDMRQDLFGHLQKLSFTYYDATKTGHLISRIANDLFNVSELAHHGPEDLIISTLSLVGALTAMFYFSPYLAAIALVPLCVMLAWGLLQGGKMRYRFRTVRERIADINSGVENSIQGIREVKSFANEKHEMRRFRGINDEVRTAKERMYGTMARFHAGMMLNIESYTLVIIAAGALLAAQGVIMFADLVGFLLLARMLMDPVRKLTHFYEMYQQGAAAFDRFIEVMDVEPDVVDRPGAVAPAEVRGAIEFRDVRFRYASSAGWILDGITLRIEPGTTAALVGESGAGKSTLAALIPRFYEAQEGAIRIDGIDVLDWKQVDLRRHIGLVQQKMFLFDATIGENILFGEPDATEDELVAAARAAHLLPFIESLPDGFETLVGERGVKLSGGQQQRVAIARVFLKNPSILVFDEATSSLDAESERCIQDAMERLSENRTTLIIAHRLTTVRHADAIYALRGGRIVEAGSHDELIERGGYYRELHARSFA